MEKIGGGGADTSATGNHQFPVQNECDRSPFDH